MDKGDNPLSKTLNSCKLGLKVFTSKYNSFVVFGVDFMHLDKLVRLFNFILEKVTPLIPIYFIIL